MNYKFVNHASPGLLCVGKQMFKLTIKALANYDRNCKKCSYLPYTPQLFSQLQQFFSTVLYTGNNFQRDIFGKIFAFLCVVCRGLNHAVIQVNQVLVATP